uniref:(California timema) hypothetical protein n=1 Tax=Timema californicum TaxID=61474 RepID=A0A7R9IYV9_TIMCA|nr:unnamed protein product [Timema californicum]
MGHCPSSLITPLTKIVLDEVKTACKKQPAKCGFQKLSNCEYSPENISIAVYQPLKLMQVVTRKVNEVCLRYLDDGQVSTLPPPELERPISACAIKNTRRRMEDRHVIIEDFHTLFNIQLCHELLTAVAVDDIDHKPSFATAKEAFHCTGISVMQHPSHTHPHLGIDSGVPVVSHGVSFPKSLTPLPSSYTIVPPADLKIEDLRSPAVQGSVKLCKLLFAAIVTENEFAWLTTRGTGSSKYVGIPVIKIVDDSPASYYAVFDGHAGTDAAVYSVCHLHQFLAESPFYPTDPVQAFKEAFLKTNFHFLEKSNIENLHSGTTALCALLRPQERKVYVAWLGDSQALLVRQGEAIQLDERHRIEEMGGCVWFWGTWRVNGQLAVSRAIGDLEYKPYVTAEPDVKVVTLNGSEDFIILGCDGLWDFVSENEVLYAIYQQIRDAPVGGRLFQLRAICKFSKHSVLGFVLDVNKMFGLALDITVKLLCFTVQSALVYFLRTCTGRSNHPPYYLDCPTVHVLGAVRDAFPTVAKENSTSYWLAWRPLSLTFSRANGKLPFLSLNKSMQQWRVYNTSALVYFLRTCTGRSNHPPYYLDCPTVHVLGAVRDAFPTVAKENSTSYWLAWRPLSLTFSRANGKLPFLSLNKSMQQWRINFVGTPFTVPTSHRDSRCRDYFSYLPPRLTLPGLFPTFHRDSRCQDYFLPPTATHMLPGLPPYTSPLSPSAGPRHWQSHEMEYDATRYTLRRNWG